MNKHHDVIVVGGGVFGCSVAYALARRSVNVLLLDKTMPGRATSASAGGLWPIGEAIGLGCGVIYHAAKSAEGSAEASETHPPEPLPDCFRDFLVASNERFSSLAEELRRRTGIDIEYRPGAGLLYLAYSDRERDFVECVTRSLPSELRPLLLSAAEASRLEPRLTTDVVMAALFPGEHQVNPMLLCEAFKRAAINEGACFRPEAKTTRIRRQGDRIVGVEVGSEFIACGAVVNAAGAWAATLAEGINVNLPVSPVRGQIVLTESLPPLLNACLSTSECYLLQKAHGEVLIGSTTERVDFDVSVTPAAIHSLASGAAHAVPLLRRAHIKRTWAGLRPGTPDELPILGPVEGLDGYLNAAGGFRTGIVASPMAGELVAQCATGEELSLPLEPFLLSRFNASPRIDRPVGDHQKSHR